MQQLARDAFAAALPDNPLETHISDKYRGDWLMKAAADVVPFGLFRPRSAQEVSAALKICTAHNIPVVPQGGLTGLTGGAVPTPGALLLSMERMTGIGKIDAVARTMEVEAGVPLQRVQEAADAAGFMFPLDIGSRGTCQIGGNLSTNAGGNRVLRYGMARAMVLGLEVVLAVGTIVSSMNHLLKNNAGFDLKQIFIGSEGTLGIITRAVLHLAPKPRSMAVSLATFADYAQCETYLALAQSRLGDSLSAFEVMWPDYYARASAMRGAAPLAPGAGAYALVEISNTDDAADAQLAAFMEEAMAASCVEDAVLATTLAQSAAIWAIRDSSGEIAASYEPVGNFDIGIVPSRIADFVTRCGAILDSRWPDIEPHFFGHVVDGNVHLIAGNFPADDLHAVELAVFEVAQAFGGSISAEHGIGLHKRDHLHLSRNAEEIALMRRLKASLDPAGILNPGKVI